MLVYQSVSPISNRLRDPVGALGWFHTDLADADARGGAYQPDQTTLGGDATRPATGRVASRCSKISTEVIGTWKNEQCIFKNLGNGSAQGSHIICAYIIIYIYIYKYIAPIIPMFYLYFHGILHICSTHLIPFSCGKAMAGASQLLRRGPTLVATAMVSRRLAVRRQGLRRCAAVAVLGTEQVLCPALSGEGWVSWWVGDGWDGPGWLGQYPLVN